MSTKDGPVKIVFATVALGFWATTAFFHLRFSLLIVTPMSTPFGPLRIADHATQVTWGSFAALVIYLAFRYRRGDNRKQTLSHWAAWAVVVLGTNHFFVCSANEYIHYPQYAILACLMVPVFDQERTGSGVAPILFWATVLGIVDEMNQYLYLCPQYGDYLDFNDFFFNELGAMAGILLVYGFRKKRIAPPSRKPFWRTKEVRFAALVSCFVLMLALSGALKVSAPVDLPPGGVHRVDGRLTLFLERKPGVYGSWQKGNPSGNYYVMNPLMGIALLLSTGAAFIRFQGQRKTEWAKCFRSLAPASRHHNVRRLPGREGDFYE
jgi:hypothetical protein